MTAQTLKRVLPVVLEGGWVGKLGLCVLRGGSGLGGVTSQMLRLQICYRGGHRSYVSTDQRVLCTYTHIQAKQCFTTD